MQQHFGKGLESLIPSKKNKSVPTLKERQEAVFSIEIEKIKPNPFQPRKEFSQEGLSALADSIKDHGILQPLLVSRIEKEGVGAEYELIAGERRLLAAKLAGLSQVPVIIKESDNRKKLEISLIENVQRLDLNSLEKALAFQRLQEEFQLTQQDIATLCGKSREAVANTIRLLDLSEEIKSALRAGKISEGHARAILMAKEPTQQKSVFAKIIRDGLSVRDAENYIRKLDVWKPKKRTLQFIEEFKELEEKLIETLGIKNLKLGMEAGQPKLTIFFKAKKDIENFVKKLS